ncbi:bis(5'-nucleosyl)-tetraphosphatase PrpE [Jeotgalibacillus aurantiacus]|uniref:bis(5'-nucleosyl)-tetraphosphatase PrpE n=1 Tax=Jeotgalibacillus aurantiacus TaxID=2763266 RepID=UPI001D0AE0CD|nr:bis(5'-nucleosyl)-tetraphosphatase PrpE [Jeotgalibacillus aurantiacus]
MKIDIIGDIHGCREEWIQLTKELGYDWSSGLPVHPENRKLAFVGDLTDRGPDSLGVIRDVSGIVEHLGGYYVPGNHCNKLYRYFSGNNVKIVHGLETTVEELNQLNPEDYADIKNKFMSLYENAPLYHIIDRKKLVIAHAGIREHDIGQSNKRIATFVLYGDITGEKNEKGMPVRRDWAKHYKGSSFVVYGHTPVHSPRFKNKTVNIDTGCVFGNKLTALRYPEMDIVSVPSSMPYVPEKFRDEEFEE